MLEVFIPLPPPPTTALVLPPGLKNVDYFLFLLFVAEYCEEYMGGVGC